MKSQKTPFQFSGKADCLRLPVIAAPMFLVSGPDLVVACCRAGIVGSFPFPNARSVAILDHWLSDIAARLADSRQAAPFAVNLTTHKSYDRLQDEIALISNHKPPIVITALGSPRAVVETVSNYGGVVIADVNTLPLARKALDSGATGLACVSAGAGGHTGSMSGFAFVSAIREFFDGLVVLAGSIGTGQAVRAAEVLGADLAYIGTRFIAAQESLADDEYKAMLIRASMDDLVLSDALTGAPAYYLRASLAKMGIDPDNQDRKGGFDLSQSQSRIKAWRDIWSAGHGVGAVRAVQPAADIVAGLEAEYQDAVDTPVRAVCQQSRQGSPTGTQGDRTRIV